MSHEYAATSEMQPQVRQAQSAFADPARVAADLASQMKGDTYSFILVFISPEYAHDACVSALGLAFPNDILIGCTSAGEIASQGYVSGHVLAVGFSASAFEARPLLIEHLDDMDHTLVSGQVQRLVSELQSADAIDFEQTPDDQFAILLCDGLSLQEDKLVALLSRVLGEIPLFGGSAGDELKFLQTQILYDGALHANAAALITVRSLCPFQIFSLDHFEGTTKQMVVTEADPENRIVSEINAEPAAKEYARLVGMDPTTLTPFTFAKFPVTVTIGDKRHVRAIQRVEEDGRLRFFCAIDEGLVLTLAQAGDIREHLESVLKDLCTPVRPTLILAFECILRRLEVEQAQHIHLMSKIMSEHNMFGFSTFGEQCHGIHSNHTLTGLAIYPQGTSLKASMRLARNEMT